jgi:tetratricopeptide (TPR) repeat protein
MLAMLAQAQHAGIAGAVNDSWETPLARATVTLTDLQSGAILTAPSNEKGEFSLAEVAPGRYDLTARAPGFRLYSRRALQFAGAVPIRMEIKLERESEPSLKEAQATAASKPGDYQALFNLGRAYLNDGQLNKALEQFQAVLKVQADYLPALLGIAEVALRVSIPNAALRYATELLRLKPGDSAATVISAVAYEKLGQPEDAANLLDDFLKQNPYDTDALLESGFVRRQQKQYAEAEKAFNLAYAIEPSNVRGLHELAEIRFALKQPEKAVEMVSRETSKDPRRSDLRKELAATEFRAGMYDKALVDYQSILEQFKDDPKQQAELYSRIALVYQKQGDFAHSIDNFKKAVQIAPATAAYVASLAAVYDLAGNTQEALKAYGQAIKLDPGNPYVMNNAAYLLVRKGNDTDADDALRLVQIARRQLADVDEVTDTLGLVYLKKDMVDSACQIFQELTEKAAANPMFHYHYGMALAKKGDKPSALDQLQLALKNQPGKEDEKEINDLIQKLSKEK